MRKPTGQSTNAPGIPPKWNDIPKQTLKGLSRAFCLEFLSAPIVCFPRRITVKIRSSQAKAGPGSGSTNPAGTQCSTYPRSFFPEGKAGTAPRFASWLATTISRLFLMPFSPLSLKMLMGEISLVLSKLVRIIFAVLLCSF